MSSGSVRATSSDYGQAFGIDLGMVLPNFSANEVQFRIFGPPYVVREARQASAEFSYLEVRVTPQTGIVIGVRAIAKFADENSLKDFGSRMALALSAKYGPNQIMYYSNSVLECPADSDIRLCSASADVDRYFRILPNRTIVGFDTYFLDGNASASLIVALDEKDSGNQWIFDSSQFELEQLAENERQRLVAQEKDGLLKGLD